MIVIVIIGVVYTLVITQIQNRSEQNKLLSLQTLKSDLLSFYKDNETKSVELLCLDDCSECDVYADGVQKARVPKDFLDTSVKLYRYDYFRGMELQRKHIWFDVNSVAHDICFSYHIAKNGVGDQIIVEYKEKVYDYTPYFSKTKIYKSIDEVQNQKEKLVGEVRQ